MPPHQLHFHQQLLLQQPVNIMRKPCYLSYHLKIGLLILFLNSVTVAVWEQKGCHIVGHSQKVDIPGCIKFTLTSNACRGYCVSYAVPSSEETLRVNNKQMITSVANCCGMTETEEVSVRVMCVNGPMDVKFKSATKCSCNACKKY